MEETDLFIHATGGDCREDNFINKRLAEEILTKGILTLFIIGNVFAGRPQ